MIMIKPTGAVRLGESESDLGPDWTGLDWTMALVAVGRPVVKEGKEGTDRAMFVRPQRHSICSPATTANQGQSTLGDQLRNKWEVKRKRIFFCWVQVDEVRAR